MSKHEDFINHILSFTKEEVRDFIEKHPNESFYAFAYDVNPKTYGIYLSFNTIDHFNETLDSYKNSEYQMFYQTKEQIERLKYNPGDWKYQNFVSIEFIYKHKLVELFDTDLDPSTNVLLDFAEKTLSKFRLTNVYKEIPKDHGFIAFCIDNEEDELEAIKRAININ